MSQDRLQKLLDEFRELARTPRDKGTMFEKLIANYLCTDPQYKNLFSDVWLWGEWKYRWGADTGIDIVAREAATGDHWAIQCKFFEPEHPIAKPDIDSFLSDSGKKFSTNDGNHNFVSRLVVTTTEKWNSNAEKAIVDQNIPVMRLGFNDLAQSPIDWTQFNLSRPDTIPLESKKTERPHQTEAIKKVIEGFKTADRGKMIMACGTGKTFTSLRLVERTVPKQGLVLFLAPSISLISQTLREWTSESTNPIRAFVVCSDTKVGKNEEDIRIHDLAYPATTDANKLARVITDTESKHRTVIFSTYQSIQVISKIQKMGVGKFDLVICDEAHRTVGVTLEEDDEASNFVKVHDNTIIKADKRLYMTATPRIYGGDSKRKAEENDAVLYSMDDEELFGQEFYRLGFGAAVGLDLLSEYKVLIVAVEEEKMATVTNSYNAAKIEKNKAIDINFATKIIGCWKGLSKQELVVIDEDGNEEKLDEDTNPMQRVVAFSRTIANSKQTTDTFKRIIDLYAQQYHNDDSPAMINCHLKHVDGTMNALQRSSSLNWLKDDVEENECRMLSNARCLAEGIDVPALDSVVFFDTRESIVDIVQSVGRVMRKAENKKYGYIILPVCIPSKNVANYNEYIDNDKRFSGIWKVIKALRAHDESLVDEATFKRKIKIITGGGGGGGSGGGGSTIPLSFPDLPISDITDAVYAAIPKKLGDREYWSEWAKDIAETARVLIIRINAMIADNPKVAEDFARFVKGLQDTLNPTVNQEDAVEMMAQHILTTPVFQALFSNTDFPKNNVVGKALQDIVEKLDDAAVSTETERLERFYDNVRERIEFAKSDKAKQDIIRNLYDTFFQNAFPNMSKKLGIVYTPIQIVDFILKSADDALRKHFGESLSSNDVQILDPFSGTGTFLVRLIQSGLIDKNSLRHKYMNELHANEIVLLAYYIATINIETAYHAEANEYQPFEGMILTDTFQMTEEDDLVDKVVLPENNSRAEQQLNQPIRVIVGNPPYSSRSPNAKNKNLDYPTLDEDIKETYLDKSSSSVNIKNLYDSYVRAIRWASNRIEERGIVAFVSSASYLDANNMSGLRKCLIEDYSHLYIINLRGDRRTAGEEALREGGEVFGSGSRTPIAITIMVKDPNHSGDCQIHYHDIGDYLKREKKLDNIEEFGGIEGVNKKWTLIKPNIEGDWINQRDPIFDKFIPLKQNDKKLINPETIFNISTLGNISYRDVWVYNMSHKELEKNMSSMIDTYNAERERYASIVKNNQSGSLPKIEDIIDTNPKKIKWERNLIRDAKKNKSYQFDKSLIREGIYRPFTKQKVYFSRGFTAGTNLIPKFFPTSEHQNVMISVSGVGAKGEFSAIAYQEVPDLNSMTASQCFPLYWYEKNESDDGIFAQNTNSDSEKYIRHDAITDWALETFHNHYNDTTITKEDIFWYVYGVFHSPEYKTRFSTDAKLVLARVPFAKDFKAFCNAGRELGKWHLNYETVEPYPVSEEKDLMLDSEVVMNPERFIVRKMNFGKGKDKGKDKSTIIYNDYLTLHEIPLEAYDYTVSGKPAIEWIIERYQLKKDKETGIVNDPNEWSDDPRYIIDLLKRVIRVSVETVKIVNNLPPLEASQESAVSSPAKDK